MERDAGPAAATDSDALRLSRALFAAYPDSLLVVDASGRVVIANDTAAALLGYSREELEAMQVEALVPAATRHRHAGYREAYTADPKPRPMGTHADLVARCKDGSHVLVEIALSPLQDVERPLVAVAIRAVEHYPRVRQALRRAHYAEQLVRLGQVAVNAPDLQTLLTEMPAIACSALDVDAATVYLIEPNGAELHVAAALNPVDGEDVGRRIPFRPDTSPGLVLAQGRPLVVTDYLTENRFPVNPVYPAAGLRSALAVPVMDQGRIVGAVSARSRRLQNFGDDELRFLESLSSILATSLQRAKSEDALNHAQRLESVGQLTGGIAHDFNNLLTIIQGNLQLLEEHPRLATDGEVQDLVTSAARAAQRGAELTAKLLTFARRQVLQPEPVDVAAMLSSMSDLLRRTLDSRIRIDVSTSTDDLTVMVDPAQLESALLNVAINARDAMPEGGILRFRAERRDEAEGIAHGDVADLGYVAISIADNGHGMSAEVRERVFEPFFTTKEAGRGTGLGLSTVYGFVQQSNGSITLETQRGVGTTITLYIPRSAEASPPGDRRPVVPRRGLEVLMVEDEPDVAAVGQKFLRALGCRVVAVDNAQAALAVLDAGATFDLLFSDISIGVGMRGTQLSAIAQERQPGLAVLLTSGFSSDLLEADQASPADWALLPKPYRREQLADAIARAIPGGTNR